MKKRDYNFSFSSSLFSSFFSFFLFFSLSSIVLSAHAHMLLSGSQQASLDFMIRQISRFLNIECLIVLLRIKQTILTLSILHYSDLLDLIFTRDLDSSSSSSSFSSFFFFFFAASIASSSSSLLFLLSKRKETHLVFYS